MATPKPKPKPNSSQPLRLYDLDVVLMAGPITKAFMKKNPIVARTIQIRSDQTLDDLHEAIFAAFDREDEHLYEFQIGGKGPMDPDARRYVTAMEEGGFMGDDNPTGKVHETAIGSLGLKLKENFAYWFDYGDDWWHQITVLAIHDVVPAGKYPKVIAKVGASPPQYS